MLRRSIIIRTIQLVRIFSWVHIQMTSYSEGNGCLRSPPWYGPFLGISHHVIGRRNIEVGPFLGGKRSRSLCTQVPAGLVHPEEDFKVPRRLDGMLSGLSYVGQALVSTEQQRARGRGSRAVPAVWLLCVPDSSAKWGDNHGPLTTGKEDDENTCPAGWLCASPWGGLSRRTAWTPLA